MHPAGTVSKSKSTKLGREAHQWNDYSQHREMFQREPFHVPHTWKFGSHVEVIANEDVWHSQRPHTHLPLPLQIPCHQQGHSCSWLCMYGGMKTDMWFSSNLGLLTPLLSRQVWLLLGHSQASPSQPSVQAHFSIMQEPRSDKRGKKI